MSAALDLAFLIPQILAVFLASTVVFDLVHVTLHRLAASGNGLLRRIGDLHEVHHRFLDERLKIQPEFQTGNLTHHVIPEYLTQVSVSLALLAILPGRVVLPALALQTLVFALILRVRGIDVNHHSIDALAAYRPFYFCVPEYHAWHHAHPEAFFSSWIKTLDHALGSGSSLSGRRVVLTGGATPLGRALRPLLEERAESVGVFDGPAGPALAKELSSLDVLVLADDESDRDLDGWIEKFCSSTKGRLLPPEVWCVGTPRALRDRTEHARRASAYFLDPRVVYRHLLVPSGALGDEAAARTASQRLMRGIERGFNFVPAAPGIAAVADYVRFRRN